MKVEVGAAPETLRPTRRARAGFESCGRPVSREEMRAELSQAYAREREGRTKRCKAN